MLAFLLNWTSLSSLRIMGHTHILRAVFYSEHSCCIDCSVWRSVLLYGNSFIVHCVLSRDCWCLFSHDALIIFHHNYRLREREKKTVPLRISLFLSKKAVLRQDKMHWGTIKVSQSDWRLPEWEVLSSIIFIDERVLLFLSLCRCASDRGAVWWRTCPQEPV